YPYMGKCTRSGVFSLPAACYKIKKQEKSLPKNLKSLFKKQSSKTWITSYENFTDQNYEALKQEALEGMAYRYKIHLQIKPEYLESFVKDFAEFSATSPQCRCIEQLKVAPQIKRGLNYFNKDGSEPKDAMPIIVIYVMLLPGTKEEKNKILNEIVHAIIQRYENVEDGIELKIGPRFNRQIHKFVWIAGGDGDDKKVFKPLVDKNELRNLVYTDDYAFFKGYEFEYKPPSH
ncbi:MAG: hypothetical protein V1855_01235, partial [bacterium]